MSEPNIFEDDPIGKWRLNPQKFVEDNVPGIKLSQQQKDGFQKIGNLVTAKIKAGTGKKMSKHEKALSKKIGMSIMSGKGTGKDAFAALCILWFMSVFPFPKIPCTAPSAHQLKDVLWSEISKWYRKSKFFNEDNPKNNLFEVQSDKVFNKEHKGKEWFAVARTANVKDSPEAQSKTLDGFHSDYMMFVVDEADGIPQPVFISFDSTLTQLCNFVLMLFNPTKRNGYAVESHQERRKDWVCLNWNAEESEIVSKNQIERYSKYGLDSNAYRIYVKGLPPLADANALIPWDWAMAAARREVEPDKTLPIIFGVDPARFGTDKSIILIKQGNVVLEILEFTKINTMELTGWVCDAISDYEPEGVFVDVIGIGSGVYDRLKELKHRVYPVNVANKSLHIKKFKRVRDELWWNLRQRFEDGTIKIPENDDELISQLSSVKYCHESDGTIKVEGKPEMRKRGLSSPDKADALALAFYKSDRFFSKASKKKTTRYHYVEQYNNPHSWLSA